MLPPAYCFEIDNPRSLLWRLHTNCAVGLCVQRYDSCFTRQSASYKVSQTRSRGALVCTASVAVCTRAHEQSFQSSSRQSAFCFICALEKDKSCALESSAASKATATAFCVLRTSSPTRGRATAEQLLTQQPSSQIRQKERGVEILCWPWHAAARQQAASAGEGFWCIMPCWRAPCIWSEQQLNVAIFAAEVSLVYEVAHQLCLHTHSSCK